MKSDGSWYARRVARSAPTPTGAPPATQRFLPFQRNAQPVQQPMQQTPAGYVPQPDPRSIRVTTENLWQAMQFWQGGKAHRVDTMPCPECGSHLFSGRTEGIMRGPPPAPHCFNCGYNGMFTQGLASTWQ